MNIAHALPNTSTLCPDPSLHFGYGPYRQCSTCGRYFDTSHNTLIPVPNPTTPRLMRGEYLHRRRLRSMLAALIRDDRWPLGLNHGKYFVGNAILDALVDAGCDRKVELERVLL